MNKILATSKPRLDVQIEWYISSLPSDIEIFVDRSNKATLVENMKEALSVERIFVALENKTKVEHKKSKKVTFKDESKKKSPKDPFDLEGLQKVLKTISNDMVEIKKQVAETSSKKPFRSFRKNQWSISRPPNVISNIESDQEEEEEETTVYADESQEEEVIELHGLCDFVLSSCDEESETEAMQFSTRSKNYVEPTQTTQK